MKSSEINLLQPRRRAWAEIDLDALAHNVSQLRSLLKGGCELMAVVKADAYGHGYEKTAQRLQREGVSAFAVAALIEGIQLREAGIKGEVLVLGYTQPRDVSLLNNYSLTQLVVDGAYAKALNDAADRRLNVHIAVDTGMHRLGIDSSKLDEIKSVFKCTNLNVTGMATHFASCDSLDADDTAFTNRQIKLLNDIVNLLKSEGCNTGKIHAQSSFGIVNYCDAQYDYARAGIMLYGVKSQNTETKKNPPLRPVLSLRAVIAQVRWIDAGESVSYGRTFKTDKPLKLATVCIGYADGIPRQMSGRGGMCIVNGIKVPIIGRISMDMLTADVTSVDNAEAGDIATLIGHDQGAQISCEDAAAAAGTITNDFLCRLGSRLPRIYLGDNAIPENTLLL